MIEPAVNMETHPQLAAQVGAGLRYTHRVMGPVVMVTDRLVAYYAEMPGDTVWSLQAGDEPEHEAARNVVRWLQHLNWLGACVVGLTIAGYMVEFTTWSARVTRDFLVAEMHLSTQGRACIQRVMQEVERNGG